MKTKSGLRLFAVRTDVTKEEKKMRSFSTLISLNVVVVVVYFDVLCIDIKI